MSLPQLVRLRSLFGEDSVSSACSWRVRAVGVEYMAVGDAAAVGDVVAGAGAAVGAAVVAVAAAVAAAVAVK